MIRNLRVKSIFDKRGVIRKFLIKGFGGILPIFSRIKSHHIRKIIGATNNRYGLSI